MRKLLVVLLALASTAAHADIFAMAKNNAGGEIVLLTTKGSCRDGTLQMFARTSGGSITVGCWFFEKPYVYATYSDGDVKVYDGAGFTVTDKYKTNTRKGTDL